MLIVYPLGELTGSITSLLASRGITETLEPFLTSKSAATKYESKKTFDNDITFKHVCFLYNNEQEETDEGDGEVNPENSPPCNEPVLQNFNLTIKRGEKILLIGKSGSGKSTIFSLPYKKFTDYTGDITVDGIDIRKIPDADYFNLVSVVHQAPFIFDDSIKNNITLFSKVSDARISDAIEKAQLKTFFEQLPKGMDTRLGENTSKISGGEKQRIALARTFIKNTPIILYDEATSALDNRTNEKCEEAILGTEQTCIIISHHVTENLKAKVDRIVILDDK